MNAADTGGDRAALVRVLKDTAERQIEQRFRDFFDNADDALFAMADKAANNILQEAYMEAMRALRREREAIGRGFQRRFDANWEGFWRGPSRRLGGETAAVGTTPGLSLVQDEALDESLAITTMAAKGENRFQGELYALNERVGKLAGRDTDAAGNPLAPRALCEAFQSTTADITLEGPARLVVLKLFDRYVVNTLGDVYTELNSLLARAGVLPQLTVQFKRNASRPGYSGAPQAHAPGTASPGMSGGGDGGDMASLFGMFQQMMDARRGPISMPAGTVPVQQGELLDNLRHIQSAPLPAIEGTWAPSAADIKATIMAAFAQGTRDGVNRALGRAEEDVIDIVGMLFEFILDDRALPDMFKALIGRLQIPIIKLAIVDKTFFAQKMHPARRLLNGLAQAGLGGADGSNGQAIYQTVERLVHRILDRCHDDVGVFAEALAELDAALAQEDRGASVAEQRTCQVSEGKEQLEIARSSVLTEIAHRLKAEGIADATRRVLEEAWKDVLLLIHLRQGTTSSAWSESMRFMDDLVWSTRPKHGAEERDKLMRTIPLLLKTLREGLTTISYEPWRMEALFKDLQAAHLACLRGDTPPATNDAPPEPAPAQSPSANVGPATPHAEVPAPAPEEQSTIEEIVLAAPETVAPPSLVPDEPADEHDRLAGEIAIGTWLEFTGENGVKQRLKIAWRSNTTGNCVFVDRRGLKATEKTQRGLAAELRRRSATVLDELPLMDRALEAMVQALKKTAA